MGLSPAELHHGDVLASIRRGPGLELRLVFEISKAGNATVCLELRIPSFRRGWSRWKGIGAIRLHEIAILLPALQRASDAIASSRFSTGARGEPDQRKLAL